MWDERIYVVCAVDRPGKTCQMLAAFTCPLAAREFAGAQPKYWYRGIDPLLAPHQSTNEEIARIRDERALGWRPCPIDQSDLDLGRYEWRELDVYVSDVPWNPVISAWVVAPSREAVVLEEP